jgi:hypothetical protein
MKKEKWLDETLIYCFIIVVFNAILLSLYHFHIDPNKNIERHYFKTCKIQYGLFKLAYFIIFISFVFSARYIVYELFSFMSASSRT